MSQGIFGTVNPNVTGGTTLATLLNAFKKALTSGFSGTVRPANLLAGGFWVDTTNVGSPGFYFQVKFYTGTVDIEAFRVNVSGNFAGGVSADSELDITRISADATGAILGIIKQRILDDGQIFDGDVVGEIQFSGRTNTATNPILGVMRWTASDDETDLAFGGFFSLYSTPDNTSTLTENLRFITGFVETRVPQKMNSLRLVGQNVATTATVSQLSATKVLVEFTGSTATDLQGVNSGQATQEIILHNRSTANVTLKNQNAGATAADRIKIASASDYVIIPDATVTLYYCTTDTRWKIKSTSRFVATKVIKPIRGVISEWVCPVNVNRVLVTAYRRKQLFSGVHSNVIDFNGAAYAWGSNSSGGLGVGDVVGRSTPTAIIGGISFARFSDGNTKQVTIPTDNTFAIDRSGNAYAWGRNDKGQLGVGDVTHRSSPVAVLGGKKFLWLWDDALFVMGAGLDGVTYSWGNTPVGTLAGAVTVVSSPVAVVGGFTFDTIDSTEAAGNGNAVGGIDVNGNAYMWGGGSSASYIKGGAGNGVSSIQVSSPVAVVGGLTFRRLVMGTNGSNVFTIGITKTGAAYAWGENSIGTLGVGDTVARSSPVAVLGGITFVDIVTPSWAGTGVIATNWAMGISEDGTLYAWGSNAAGNLGTGDTIARSTPTAVLGGLKFKEIQCGLSGQAFGITTDGDMYAWGANAGLLGIGTNSVAESSPIAVVGGIKWSQFAARGPKFSTMLAVSQEGSLYAWGQTGAEAGVGLSSGTASSPVAVLGGITFDNRTLTEVISIPVVSGTTYRIALLNGRQATFGSVNIGLNIDRISIEYDKQGD